MTHAATAVCLPPRTRPNRTLTLLERHGRRVLFVEVSNDEVVPRLRAFGRLCAVVRGKAFG